MLARSHFIAAIVFFIATDGLIAEDWPQFLGPGRNGISPETNLIDAFSDDGPKTVWKVAGGVGMSAIAVVDGHAITMWNDQQNQRVVSLKPSDGSENWSTSIGPIYKNSMGDGPRATPTIVDDTVFVYGGDGILAGLSLGSGDVVWSVDVPRELRTKPSEYGMSSSPLVFGDSVIVTCGGTGSAVAAFNKTTGAKKWSAVDGAAGYASVALLNVAGAKQLVSFNGTGVYGLDPSSGKLLWEYPFQTPYDCNTASPINVAEYVFISAGENHGSVMLDIQSKGGSFEVKEVWASVDTKSVLRNEWQTSVLIDGHLYGFDNVGSAGPVTHLTCIDAKTGSPKWRKTRFGKGNLIAADGKLWITTMSGELILVKASPEAYIELGRSKLFGKTRQTLSIKDGIGYIRDDQNVMCFDLRK